MTPDEPALQWWMDDAVTELAREVKEALEREGYEVEEVKPMAALPGPDEHGRRGLLGRGHALAAHVAGRVGEGDSAGSRLRQPSPR